MKQTTLVFESERKKPLADAAAAPAGYKGLYAFHKYWGKKPHEILGFLIETLSEADSVVIDPFVGSGVCAREAVIRGRRFIGVDINPLAIQLSELMVSPPLHTDLKMAIKAIENACRERILASYALEGGGVATHYLWDESDLLQVWTMPAVGRRREERSVTDFDRRLVASFDALEPLTLRPPRFFSNSRINAHPEMSRDHLLTKRAQFNLSLLLDAIYASPPTIQPALELCLTAAVGQMTKMVFAVTGRGKKTRKPSTKVEVGSWVIGYWRPKVHFEVNVWNCFLRRVNKLLKSLQVIDFEPFVSMGNCLDDVVSGNKSCVLINGDAIAQLKLLPSKSVELVITDPPHSDRVPYLELSELWNSLLGKSVDFDSEIVISNAKERGKSEDQYVDSMQQVLAEMARILKPKGFLVVLFNSVGARDWDIFRHACAPNNDLLQLLGRFSCKYSAGSVVQDNRAGSLESDVGLVFGRFDSGSLLQARCELLSSLPGWSRCELSDLPGG